MTDIIVHSTITAPEGHLDTIFRCPACNGMDAVLSRPAQTGHQWQHELKQFVPRQQDRWCLACGHKWMVVLPPASMSLLP